MKVFVVVDVYDGNTDIVRVFSTKENALNWIKTLDIYHKRYYQVWDYELDNFSDI